MAALSKRQSTERQQGVLNYFLTHPEATGDEAQKALIDGKLTGSKGPPMGIGLLFKLKRQAEDLRRKGAATGSPPRPGAPAEPPAPSGGIEELRALTARLQRLLSTMPDVAELRITSVGAKVVRTLLREETL